MQSSLIQAILHELPLYEGKISVRGTISYASQEPWLFSGSVKENILFDSPMDNDRYNQVNAVFLNYLQNFFAFDGNLILYLLFKRS